MHFGLHRLQLGVASITVERCIDYNRVLHRLQLGVASITVERCIDYNCVLHPSKLGVATIKIEIPKEVLKEEFSKNKARS